MDLFQFSLNEIFTFFAVLVRYSVLISILPFVGDRTIPSQVKILLSLVLSITLFPALVTSGQVVLDDANQWTRSASSIVTTILLEVVFGLLLGFSAKLVFEGISFGANLVGHFVGLAAASTYDPHQESQTQVMAQIQTSLAMLIFLAIDGHHYMLRASLESYKIVGLGRAVLTGTASLRLIQISGDVLKFGLQLAAPVAVSMFAINVIFGILSKSVPQLNILSLSFAVSVLVGLMVLFLSFDDFQIVVSNALGRIAEWMVSMMLALRAGS